MNLKIDLTDLLEVAEEGFYITFDEAHTNLISARSKAGDTLLHVAASRGVMQEVAYLVKEGANIDAQRDYLFTPLHCAAICGNKKVFDYLLRCGANKLIRDYRGLTPHDCMRW